jgi:hypothetical protein
MQRLVALAPRDPRLIVAKPLMLFLFIRILFYFIKNTTSKTPGDVFFT